MLAILGFCISVQYCVLCFCYFLSYLLVYPVAQSACIWTVVVYLGNLSTESPAIFVSTERIMGSTLLTPTFMLNSSRHHCLTSSVYRPASLLSCNHAISYFSTAFSDCSLSVITLCALISASSSWIEV